MVGVQRESGGSRDSSRGGVESSESRDSGDYELVKK